MNHGQSSCVEDISFSEHEKICNEMTKHQEEGQPKTTSVPEMKHVYGTFSEENLSFCKIQRNLY